MPKPKLTPDQIRAKIVGGKTVAEWDKGWEPLANAFTVEHPELQKVIGLFRTRLHGEVTYIVRAVELKRGIKRGLERISGPDQTGNRGPGARMIRKHIDQVEVDILRVSGVTDPVEVTKALKREMNKLYDPAWAKSAKWRMEMVRRGIIKPD